MNFIAYKSHILNFLIYPAFHPLIPTQQVKTGNWELDGLAVCGGRVVKMS